VDRALTVERKALDESVPCLFVVFVTWQHKDSTASLSRSPRAVLLGGACSSFALLDLTKGTRVFDWRLVTARISQFKG
jgi:hypothetical protein